eukprot:scaffold31556_cov62-Attheya_sp.AAC.2
MDNLPIDIGHTGTQQEEEAHDASCESPYINMERGVPTAIMKNPNMTNLELEESLDDDDDNTAIAKTILSSVFTVDGIQDIVGFNIVCFVSLVGDMSRGVFFPTMWPLVQSLGGSTVTLGYSVAAFSFGRILVSPIFGGWSVIYGYKRTLLLSTCILLCGTLLYGQVVKVGRTDFFIFTQTILGFGSGTLGVTRAFVAEVTPTRSRTTYMAMLTTVQYAGFAVTPFIGAIFVNLFNSYDVAFDVGFFSLNEFTAPAYFMSLDRERITAIAPKVKKSSRQLAVDAVAKETTWFGWTVYDAVIFGCMLLSASTKGSIACFETLGISFATSHFDLSNSRAGNIVATCGLLGVFSLLSMGQIAKRLSDIQMISGGIFIMCLGAVSLADIKEGENANSWRYFISIFMIYSIGYPIGHTALIGMFSKIVGRRPQGTLLGWFASAGSMARMAFPIFSGYIANYGDMSMLFYGLTVILGISIVFVLWNKTTLKTLSR